MLFERAQTMCVLHILSEANETEWKRQKKKNWAFNGKLLSLHSAHGCVSFLLRLFLSTPILSAPAMLIHVVCASHMFISIVAIFSWYFK